MTTNLIASSFNNIASLNLPSPFGRAPEGGESGEGIAPTTLNLGCGAWATSALYLEL